MRKAAIILVIAVFTLLAGYIGGNYFINKYTRDMIGILAEQGKGYGIALVRMNFQRAFISSPTSIKWQGIQAAVYVPGKGENAQTDIFSVAVNAVKISLMSSGLASLEAWNFDIIPVKENRNTGNDTLSGNSSAGPQTKTVHGDYFFIVFPYDPLHPTIGIRNVLNEINLFASKGKTSIPVGFYGSIAFSILGGYSVANLRIENRGKENVLIIDRQDVKRIAHLFDDKVITDNDIDIVAENPLIAMKLLHIKNRARTTALTSYQNDPTVPEDAFRHVLWSYLLTREFGEEFAKIVTDAHEEGLTGNTEAESRMDYRNNEVGRKYALKGVDESSILGLVWTDPMVVRKPE